MFRESSVGIYVYLGDISDGDVREVMRKFAKKVKYDKYRPSFAEIQGSNYCNLPRRGKRL